MRRISPRPGRPAVRVTLVCGIAGSALVFGGLPSVASEPQATPEATFAVPVNGPSDDTAAISDAAEALDRDEPRTVAELVDATAAAPAIALAEDADGTVGAVSEAGIVQVAPDGAVSLTPAEGPGLTIEPAVDASAVQVIDGAVVASDIAPATDLVTRATTDGVQMVAVLANDTAPREVEFPVTLPPGAQFEQQADGSISVVADVVVDAPAPGELDRVNAAVESILGGTQDGTEISAAQWDALAQVPPVVTTPTSQKLLIATLETPWAVDANGNPVETYYQVSPSGIEQVLLPSEESVYPLTADPHITWAFVKEAGKCVVGVGLLLSPLAAAKLVKMISKIDNYLRTLDKVWFAAKNLGGAKGFFQKLPAYVKDLKKPGSGLSAQARADMNSVLSGAGSTIMSIAGVYSCYTAFRQFQHDN